MKRKLKKRQRENIRDGTKAAMYLLMVQDRRASRIAPFGYRFSADGKGLELDEAEQAVTDELYEIARSNTYHETARQLNEKGLRPRSGRRWYPSTVRAIVLRTQWVKEEKARWLWLTRHAGKEGRQQNDQGQACLFSKGATYVS